MSYSLQEPCGCLLGNDPVLPYVRTYVTSRLHLHPLDVIAELSASGSQFASLLRSSVYRGISTYFLSCPSLRLTSTQKKEIELNGFLSSKESRKAHKRLGPPDIRSLHVFSDHGDTRLSFIIDGLTMDYLSAKESFHTRQHISLSTAQDSLRTFLPGSACEESTPPGLDSSDSLSFVPPYSDFLFTPEDSPPSQSFTYIRLCSKCNEPPSRYHYAFPSPYFRAKVTQVYYLHKCLPVTYPLFDDYSDDDCDLDDPFFSSFFLKSPSFSPAKVVFVSVKSSLVASQSSVLSYSPWRTLFPFFLIFGDDDSDSDVSSISEESFPCAISCLRYLYLDDRPRLFLDSVQNVLNRIVHGFGHAKSSLEVGSHIDYCEAPHSSSSMRMLSYLRDCFMYVGCAPNICVCCDCVNFCGLPGFECLHCPVRAPVLADPTDLDVSDNDTVSPCDSSSEFEVYAALDSPFEYF